MFAHDARRHGRGATTRAALLAALSLAALASLPRGFAGAPGRAGASRMWGDAAGDPGTVVYRGRPGGHGLGVDMCALGGRVAGACQCARDAAAAAAAPGRGACAPVVRRALIRRWRYALGACPQGDMSCFFEPLPSEGDYCARAATPADAAKLLLRPNARLRAEMDAVLNSTAGVKTAMDALNGNGLCAVVHVRNGDTALNFGFGKADCQAQAAAGTEVAASSARCVPKLAYVPASTHFRYATRMLGELARGRPDGLASPPTVLLLTDDESVSNASTSAGALGGVRVVTFPRPRFAGAAGGWEEFWPSGSRMREMAWTMLELEAAGHCRAFVGTRSSFGRLVRWLMPLLPAQGPMTVVLDNMRRPL